MIAAYSNFFGGAYILLGYFEQGWERDETEKNGPSSWNLENWARWSKKQSRCQDESSRNPNVVSVQVEKQQLGFE